MRVICSAVVPDEKRRKALCTCVQIIGGTPKVNGDKVSVEYEGSATIALKYASLFERYDDHDIKTTISERR